MGWRTNRKSTGSSQSLSLIIPNIVCFHNWKLFQTTSKTGYVTKARRKDKDSPQPTPEEPKLYLEEAVLEQRVPETELRELVLLPEGLDYNEWLASHTFALFEHINLIYGTISEFCTMSGCPDMNGPGNRQYLWFDEKGKKCKVAAPQYVDYVMTFTQKTINDETLFPTKFANDFPSSLECIVKKILRLLFHVIAHIYQVHYKEIVLLNLHSHLNCIFAHFVLFNEHFHMIDDKETEILQDLVLALKLSVTQRSTETTLGLLLSTCSYSGDSSLDVKTLQPSFDDSKQQLDNSETLSDSKMQSSLTEDNVSVKSAAALTKIQ